MTAFRDFKRVANNKVEIILPNEFEDQEVEVIVMPKNEIPDDLSYLTEEIQKGLDSGISEKTHEQVMQELKERYA